MASGGTTGSRSGRTTVWNRSNAGERRITSAGSSWRTQGRSRLQVTDYAFLNRAALVTRQRLESIGFTVDLKAMDSSTFFAVRARKEPPDKGGWNLAPTWWTAADAMNPAVHYGLSPGGPGAWYGWHDFPRLDKLIAAWLRATDQRTRKQIADDIQKVALGEVAYVPWGGYFRPMAFRKNVQGILKFTAPLFRNVVVK